MNRKDLLAYHDDFTKRMKQICVAKNQDYAGPGADDPFANFRRVEAMGIATTEQGFLTRLTDKLSRLSSFVEAGTLAVKDESVTDTCLDGCNYLLLFAAYLESKRAESK